MSVFGYLKSTILSKWVMAITGLILGLFITGHALGNAQMFLGRDVYNAYAHFLQGLGDILWIIRSVLFLSLVLHVITSVRLKFLNLSAKPDRYQVKNYIKAKLTSRTMIWTGIMIFAFLVYHLLHFTMGQIDTANYGHPDYYGPGNIFVRHDIWGMMIKSFSQPVIAVSYVVWVTILGFHLNHAIQSMFQTLGWNHPKYFRFLQGFSVAYSWILTLVFLSLPISVFIFKFGRDML